MKLISLLIIIITFSRSASRALRQSRLHPAEAGPRTYSRTREAMNFAQLTSSRASTSLRPFSVSPAGSVWTF